MWNFALAICVCVSLCVCAWKMYFFSSVQEQFEKLFRQNVLIWFEFPIFLLFQCIVLRVYVVLTQKRLYIARIIKYMQNCNSNRHIAKFKCLATSRKCQEYVKKYNLKAEIFSISFCHFQNYMHVYMHLINTFFLLFILV